MNPLIHAEPLSDGSRCRSPGHGRRPESKRLVLMVEFALEHSICCKARAAYTQNYWDGEISLSHLRRRRPFVAKELGVTVG